MKCPFCNKKLDPHDGHHIYKCKKNNLLDKYETKFQYIKYNHEIISKKNTLYDEYSVKLKSLPDLRDEYRISYRNIIFLLDYYDIKKRTKKSSSNLISKKKYKKTCMDKYGVDNVSKLQSVKLKKKLTYKKKKFIDDLKDKKDKYEWIKNESLFGKLKNLYKTDNKDIIKEEFNKITKLYHSYWNDLTDEQKNEITNLIGILETRVSVCLDKLNISYTRNFKIGKKKFDFRINNTFIIIEVNSDFWHANPSKYKDTDVLEFPFRNEKVINIWNKDFSKKLYAEKNGYKVLYIWEKDMKEMNDNDLFLFLIEKLRNNLN